ncbi:hypothetical protein Droror1_Dr00024258 [Drosera rotundifolia]
MIHSFIHRRSPQPPITKFPLLLRRRRHLLSLFSTATVAAAAFDNNHVDSDLFSILSLPRWQAHPDLTRLLLTLTNSTISSLFSNPDLHPSAALAFFHFLPEQIPGFNHYSLSHINLIRFLIRLGRFGYVERIRVLLVRNCADKEEAKCVLEFVMGEMRGREETVMDVRGWNNVLMMLGRVGFVEELRGVWEAMEEDRVEGNVYSYNTMVNGACMVGDVREAEGWVRRMRGTGVRLDWFTWTSLVLGHCRNTNVEKAREVFEMMREKGCRRNEVTYNYLIHGGCEAGRGDEGMTLLSRMEAEDECKSNVRTYTVLISALCKVGRRR